MMDAPRFRPAAFGLCLLLAGTNLFAQDEPPLPPGLEKAKKENQEEPPLPAGLKPQEQEEPELPPGLGDEKKKEPGLPPGLSEEERAPEGEEGEAKGFLEGLPFDLTGFLEGRAGYRLKNDRYEKDMSIGEARLQLGIEKRLDEATFNVTADFLYDHVTDHHEIRLEKGEGWIDLREANAAFTPAEFMDMKVGRQILTWGTGDLIFINDLFPKDWNSFFIGRDEEYLKAPSDAVKASFFSDKANLNIVYTPRFDPDRYIDGRRISFWNPALGRLSGRDAPVRADWPDDWLEEDEIALRLYRNLSGYEVALYGYHGYWKSPAGLDPATGLFTFPELSVLGASMRGNVAEGIGNVEAGYYHSGDDTGGGDPLVRNSELRFLAGYEQELAMDLTGGFQYYLEWMMDYGDYQRSLPPGAKKADEDRHVVTVRLTQLLMNQNLELSLFTYYSPSDADAYLRPRVHYKVDDHLSVEAGANLFDGKDRNTFFGQFEKNTNIYAGLRYSF